jgi:hypothetical protein
MKKFIKGMHKDSGRVDQPPNTYRDALNANLYYTKGAITNEEGTTSLGSTGTIIGNITLLNDEILIFSIRESVSTISLVQTKIGLTTILYRNVSLNFQDDHPITGEFRVDAKNDTIVYFTDNYHIETDSGPVFNPPRTFNVTRQLDYIENNGNVETLYDDAFSFDVNKLNLFPEVGRHSIIKKVDIIAGGALASGSYQLALAYSDENFLETDYFVVSNAVSIFPAGEEILPIDSITGAPANTPTNKSIKFTLQGFSNNNYTFLQPAIIKTIGGSTTAIKLERTKRLTTDGGEFIVTYTGLEDVPAVAVDDILINKVKYDTAKSIAQLDNRLYLANLRGRKDIGYQKFANRIQVVPIQISTTRFDNRAMNITTLNSGYAAMLIAFGKTIGQNFLEGSGDFAITQADGNETVDPVYGTIRYTFFQNLRRYLTHNAPGDSAEFVGDGSSWQLSYNLNGKLGKGYKNYMFNWKHKSYRRGEVYAFYISFILKDGSETFAYHIPGRVPVCVDPKDRSHDVPEGVCETQNIGSQKQLWEDIADTYDGVYPSEIAEIYGPNVGIYQIADTSLNTDVAALSQVPTNTSGECMGFWNNQNERYPINLDFLNKDVNMNTGAVVSPADDDPNNDLRNKLVRHHKMPSNLGRLSFVKRSEEWNVEHSYSSWDTNQDLITNTILDNQDTDDHANLAQEYNKKDIVNRDQVKILGIELKNIKIPKNILSQVRGYKVYYAKRKQEDKTILGQSIAVPAHPRYASTPIQSRLISKKGPYKRGFYLYGGLTHTDDNSMLLASASKYYLDIKGGEANLGRYVGHPVFTFHDFDVLRKKPDLTGATHVTCQYATIFRAFQGGPGAWAEPADIDNLFPSFSNLGNNIGTATRVTAFTSLGWVHPDLGNTTNFSVDGEVYDITDQLIDRTEDVTNPYGLAEASAAGGEKRKRGKQQKIDNSSSDVKATELMIRSWKGQVNVAAAYLSPGEAMNSESLLKGGAFKGTTTGQIGYEYQLYWGHSENDILKRQNFWMYALDPNSKKYVEGKLNNSVPDASSFQGASILYNRGGESSLALGLISGLPALKGVRPKLSSAFNANESAWNLIPRDLVKWGDDNKWCFPDAPRIPTTRIPRHTYAQYGNVDDFPNTLTSSVAKGFRGYRYNLEPNNAIDGYPAAWMLNINAIKTDVFNPFDKQELVWTGYYKEIEDVSLIDGVVTDLDSNDMNNPTTQNYYRGAKSGFIFGGDTFITRYSFRTTSQSYGHSYFRGATSLNDPGSAHSFNSDNVNDTQRNRSMFYLPEGTFSRFQSDIPNSKNSLLGPEDGWGQSSDMPVWFAGNNNDANSPFNLEVIDSSAERRKAEASLLGNADNFVQGTVDPVSTIFSFLCESDSNIGLRHGEDKEKGVTVKYFDKDSASSVLFDPPTNDQTHQDNLIYNEDYSKLNDKKVAQPYPKRKPGDENIYEFATRVIRSKPTGLFIGDKYREFLALDFKDIVKTKGDIWSLFVHNGTLVLHTERSLFITRGKEELQISAATAFVGSGNIFSQEPGEALSTALGYGGTTSILSGVSTPHGRFWVSRRDRKCYLYNQGVKEISTGMESWFRENMPFLIESYGIDATSIAENIDATTASVGFGFSAGYDPKYKRILVTKKEPIPTAQFIQEFNKLADRHYIEVVISTAIATKGQQTFFRYDTNGNEDCAGCGEIKFGDKEFFTQGGWTLSYYPELEVWGSRHSYLPRMYSATPEDMYSFNSAFMWEHSNNAEPGNFYDTTYPFELEFIDNSDPGVAKVFSSLGYWMDIVKKDGTHVTEYETKTYPGFTSFHVYNTTQVSGIATNINYLSNARLVDKFWYINSFRDFSKFEEITNSYINTGIENVVGGITTSILSSSETEPMFTSEGVVNSEYVNTSKLWYERKRFIDHYLGVRLSNDNTSTNLVYLYAAGTKFRKSNR